MARFWCALLCAVVSAVFAFFLVLQTNAKRASLALSTLLVRVEHGHGSGVHIGNRFVVTAAHVVGNAKQVSLVTDKGGEYLAEVLWSNEGGDVALLRAYELPGVAASRLNCDETLDIGQLIEAVGNPGQLEFVHSWGRVSSPVKEYFRWKVARVTDLGIAPGSSGGPVFDHAGRVVGIVVGVALTYVSMVPSPTNYSFIVPAREGICPLLTRN